MDTFGRLSMYFNGNENGKVGGFSSIPIKISDNMLKLFPVSKIGINTNFIDLCCKDARLLVSAKNMMMASENYLKNFKSKEEAEKHLLDNLIFGLAPTQLTAALIRKELYGDQNIIGNIRYVENLHQKIKENNFNDDSRLPALTLENYLKQEFGIMKFSCALQNPPYDDGICNEFIRRGFELLKPDGCEIAITPAKHINGLDETFNELVVPHISDIVYYRYSRDIFDIWEHDGIAYYKLDNNIYDEKTISGVCSNSSFAWEPYKTTDKVLLSNIHKDIIKKALRNNDSMMHHIKEYSKYGAINYDGEPFKIDDNYLPIIAGKTLKGYVHKNNLKTQYGLDKYKVVYSTMVGFSQSFDKNNKTLGIVDYSIIKPNEVPKGSFKIIKFYDKRAEAESFVSYMNTKTIAFLFYCGVSANSVNKDFYRYIPNIDEFNRIYVDYPDGAEIIYTENGNIQGYRCLDKNKCEYVIMPDENGFYTDNGKNYCSLYYKHNFSQKEINTIENLIKERK